MAITQMEAVANNPSQLQMAAQQMKNMSESELDQAVKQTGFNGGDAAAGGDQTSSSTAAARCTKCTTQHIPITNATSNKSIDKYDTRTTQTTSSHVKINVI